VPGQVGFAVAWRSVPEALPRRVTGATSARFDLGVGGRVTFVLPAGNGADREEATGVPRSGVPGGADLVRWTRPGRVWVGRAMNAVERLGSLSVWWCRAVRPGGVSSVGSAWPVW
jgi:hypothetical protein